MMGDRYYGEAELIPQYRGHPLAPLQAAIGEAWRAAYFHAQNNGLVLLQQPPNFNVRDYIDEATIRRTVLPTADGFAGIAKGYRRLAPGQNVLVAHVMYAPRSTNALRVAHRFSCYAPDTDETDLLIFPRDINAEGSAIGRFQGAAGMFHNWNNRSSMVAGSVDFPFTAGFTVRMDRLELPIPTTTPTTSAGQRVRVLLEIRANQLSSLGDYNVPIHTQPLAVLVHAEHRR